ncbi:MAG: hypothetical protein AB1797_07450 [bacterium]
MLDARSSMLDLRCSIFDAGKGFSIQDRGSRLCLCALVALWLNSYSTDYIAPQSRNPNKSQRHRGDVQVFFRQSWHISGSEMHGSFTDSKKATYMVKKPLKRLLWGPRSPPIHPDKSGCYSHV